MQSITHLHDAIVSGLRTKLDRKVAYVGAYPALNRVIPFPSVIIELTDMEPGDDPGSGETALIAHFQARIVIDPTTANAELKVRELAAHVAIAITHEVWDLPITMSKLTRISETPSRPELEGYLIWTVEWSHELHLGELKWPYDDETGKQLQVGYMIDDDKPNEYIPVGDDDNVNSAE